MNAPTSRTRVRRLPDRDRYDIVTIRSILDAGMVCHLAYAVNGRPFVIPTLYGRDGDTVFVHGSSASRTLLALRDGIEACLAVTHLDGLVMARSGFHSSVNYRSVVLFGTARPVTGTEDKLAALRAVMEHIVPGRWDEVREPTERELKATLVLALPIDEASAKVRTGPAKDDEEDYALPIWAGVVPVRSVLGPAIPDPRLGAGIAGSEAVLRLLDERVEDAGPQARPRRRSSSAF